MSNLTKSLCWAAAFILLAVANSAGLIADSDAATMYTVLPALWVATTLGGTCLRKGAA